MLTRLALIILALITTIISNSEQSSYLSAKKLYGQFIQSIKVNHPKSISFSWDWVKGTPNITIRYSENVVVTDSENDGVLKLDVATKDGNGASSIVNNNQLSIILLLAFFSAFYGFQRHFQVAAILAIVAYVYCDTSSIDDNTLHIEVPIDYVKTVCVNQDPCFPVTCSLSLTSKFSSIPSNNRDIFKDNYCNLKKPDGWDDWVFYYFKTNVSTERFYFRDSDNDGLVNLIEFYGDKNIFGDKTVNKTNRNRRSNELPQNIGSNPLDADSDKDLLLDGFEYYNGMSPKQPNNQADDEDTDGLSNLKEQIHGTNPTNPDSDGDGVTDGTEVSQNTDPNDPMESKLSPEDENSFAMIKLTIGDHSGSHSERYTLNVGSISHQSPGFGLVGSGTYKFSSGLYTITVNHVASNLPSPDYDYTARVEKVSGKASAVVEDPQKLLGVHHESNYDYTDGKSATLNVTADCSTSSCSCIRSCDICKSQSRCYWQESSKSCKTSFIPLPSLFDCACSKCLDWYNEEIKDTRWLEELNREFKCPCRAILVNNEMLPVDNPSNKTWEADSSCTNPDSSGCKKYHPGASGCLRSADHTASGAAQQCCYGSDGKLLRAGSPGAGTPDKQYAGISNSLWLGHYNADVKTYANCCQDCEKKSYCDYYIKGVRKGDDSHCY